MSETISVKLFEHFSPLSDPRVERTKLHPLLDIIGLAICAVICGANGWEAIETYGKAKETWLKQFLTLPNGIPGHDTIRRVFIRLSPTEFQDCFQDWIQAIARQTGGQIISLDGKTLRQSYDPAEKKAALHMVSAWASTNRLVLGQVKTAEKSNEITAIPELLNLLVLEGCIVTIDAMDCQTAIASKIVDKGVDYVLALKGNQGPFIAMWSIFLTSFKGRNPSPNQNLNLSPRPPSLRNLNPSPRPAPPSEPEPESTPALAPEPDPESVHTHEQKRKAWEEATAYTETVDGDHGRIEIRRY